MEEEGIVAEVDEELLPEAELRSTGCRPEPAQLKEGRDGGREEMKVEQGRAGCWEGETKVPQ